MAIRKNMTKLGNSCAIVIDKNIMDLLDMNSETPVEIALGSDGQSLILRPIRDEQEQNKRRRRLEAAKKESIARQGGAYEKLAKR